MKYFFAVNKTIELKIPKNNIGFQVLKAKLMRTGQDCTTQYTLHTAPIGLTIK